MKTETGTELGGDGCEVSACGGLEKEERAVGKDGWKDGRMEV